MARRRISRQNKKLILNYKHIYDKKVVIEYQHRDTYSSVHQVAFTYCSVCGKKGQHIPDTYMSKNEDGTYHFWTREDFEKRIEFESDVSVITILICFMMIFIFVIIIVIFLIFHSKIPSTFLYIVVAMSIVGISIISTLYGEELTVFCEKILEYQMNIVNNNMMNIY